MLPTREKKVLVKPRALREGDRVGIVAPSSRPATPAVVAAAERVVREMGFKPVLGKHVMSIHGFMAGTDSERLSDLVAFFSDDSIAGIFCITGGYGAMHLLPFLDYRSIAASPKVFVGCDDNTVLLDALFEHSGLVSFYGPNLDGIETKTTFDRFRSAVTCSDVFPTLDAHASGSQELSFNKDFFCPVEGDVEGHTVGGNLTALVSLLGTPYEPRFSGSLILLDDIHEQTGMLDRWFTTLYLAGHLQTCRGVVCGAFEDCGPKDSWNMLSVMDVFSDRLRYLGTPSCFGMPFGQTRETTLVPIGINAKLSAASGRLEFGEPALT
jgi:muramoyltetrapeptide carboxypeptidase